MYVCFKDYMQSDRNVIAGDSSDVMYIACSCRFKQPGQAMVPQVNSLQSNFASSHTTCTDVQTLNHPHDVHLNIDINNVDTSRTVLHRDNKLNSECRGRSPQACSFDSHSKNFQNKSTDFH